MVDSKLTSNLICHFSTVQPEVEIDANSLQVNQFSELLIKCKVSSLTPATTTWLFGTKVLNVKEST